MSISPGFLATPRRPYKVIWDVAGGMDEDPREGLVGLRIHEHQIVIKENRSTPEINPSFFLFQSFYV